MKTLRYIFTCLASLFIIGGGAMAADLTPEQVEFFESRIRPVLAQDCYECHSTEGKSKGGLLLDTRAAMLQGGDSGAVVVPGDPDASLLIRSIRHESEDIAMPKLGAKLDQAIIADFEKWIAMGLPDPRDKPPTAAELAKDTDWGAIMERRKSWWSFQPIAKPEVPKGADHAVDAFVRQKLQEHDLEPSASASPEVIVRRLYYTLVGLPPTPQQLAEFEAAWNADPDAAIDTLATALLENPHFGERWARHWMDWMRYAESHGSEGDPNIPNAKVYRDYLIRALNADVPYDQLLREHVAGDLLPDPRINKELGINESAIGPAHWRMVYHGFAPTDALDEMVRFTDDQINVFSKAFLGLTVSCARCHDHKFDAISQADYYAFFGILASTRPAMHTMDLPQDLDLHREELQSLKDQIRVELSKSWLEQAREVDWEMAAAQADKANDLLYPLHLVRKSTDNPQEVEAVWNRQVEAWKGHHAAWKKHQEGSAYAKRWDLRDPETYKNWYTQGEGMEDGVVTAGAFALNMRGDSVVRDIFPASVISHGISDKHRASLESGLIDLEGKKELWLRVAGDGEAMARYVVRNYPRRGTVYPVTTLKEKGWAWQKYVLDYWEGEQIHIELVTANDAPLLVKNSERSWFGIQEAVLLDKGQPAPPQPREFLAPLFTANEDNPPKSSAELADRYSDALETSLVAWHKGEVTDEQALFLEACLEANLLPNSMKALPNVSGLVSRYRELEAEIPVPRRVPGLSEGPTIDQPLYVRGDHKKPGDPVPRRFLEAIDDSSYGASSSGRLELADDLLRADNPFTSRVLVNRVWHYLFGKGLVPTVDNFGRLGEKPSHPELLDHLATRFVDQGWSIKELIHYLVTSETWRQDSQPSSKASVLDPENQWLSHANVRRLEAEAIRDALLAVSGKLDDSMYHAVVDGKDDRRSVYVRVKRNSLDPFLQAFDAPVPFSTTGRRDVTNVPAQSLTLLNDPFVIGLAKTWASQLNSQPELKNTEARLRHMFQVALSREPRAEELSSATAFLEELQEQYAELRQERARLETKLASFGNERNQILDPVRDRLLAELEGENGEGPKPPKPIAHWAFDEGFEDRIGNLDGEPYGAARIESGALILDGKSYVSTPPLKTSLGEKTLEALVQLDGLDQRGGGVMTVQNLQGRVFDSIVFGERKPRHWLAGSDHHNRTDDFNGVEESDAGTAPVHITIAYDADGRIRAYRNGQLYGEPYSKAAPVSFEAGESQVLFGLRHASPSGNRLLTGRILEARLYDWALNDGEVAAAVGFERSFVTEREVMEALSESQKADLVRLETDIESLRSDLEQLGEPGNELQVWADMAHAIFNLKEFIFLK